MSNYDTWKLATPPEYEDEPDSGEIEAAPDKCDVCGLDDCAFPGSCGYDADPEPRRTPPPGSWAETARVMASMFPDFDWDAWKDEMKEQD